MAENPKPEYSEDLRRMKQWFYLGYIYAVLTGARLVAAGEQYPHDPDSFSD